MAGRRVEDPCVFFGDGPGDTITAVIVGFTDRHPKGGGVAEVIDFNLLPTMREAENWAAEIIGPLNPHPSYVRPDKRH